MMDLATGQNKQMAGKLIFDVGVWSETERPRGKGHVVVHHAVAGVGVEWKDVTNGSEKA
jgi:hypothetical protein